MSTERPAGEDDEFTSAEANDLANCSDAEFSAWWRLWFEQAQATNHLDRHRYSHGVLTVEPGYEDLDDDG